MVGNGSRSVTQSGASSTAESSVACLAFQWRRSTMSGSTSEYCTFGVNQPGDIGCHPYKTLWYYKVF